MKPIIVAEIGTNWDPDRWQESWDVALEQAAAAGATHAKGQDWFPLRNMDRSSKWKARCMPWTLTPRKKRWIAEAAMHHGLQFFTSVFTVEALLWAQNHNYPLIKLASSEAANDKLIRLVSGKVPTVVSFGEPCAWARKVLTLTMLNMRNAVIPCACVAKYPCHVDVAIDDLERLANYKELGLNTGYSNHVTGNWAGLPTCSAIARGAVYFEYHFKSTVTPKEAPDNGAWALTAPEFLCVADKIHKGA